LPDNFGTTVIGSRKRLRENARDRRIGGTASRGVLARVELGSTTPRGNL
jgi:hypothetical protein